MIRGENILRKEVIAFLVLMMVVVPVVMTVVIVVHRLHRSTMLIHFHW